MPPAGAKAEAALRKQKDAKQKKLLLILAPLLLGLLAWQGPGIVKAFTGGDSAPAPAAAPAPTGTSPDPASAPPPSTAIGEAPVDGSAPVSLPDSDLPIPADAGQLVSFDLFVGKDPFKQQVVAKEPAAGAGTPSDPTSPTGGGAVPPDPVITPIDDDDPGGNGRPTSGSVTVNGAKETIAVGAAFPSSDPIFLLESISGNTARIGLVSGEFSNGAETIPLKVGETVTLVSQPDGLRYKITLYSVF